MTRLPRVALRVAYRSLISATVAVAVLAAAGSASAQSLIRDTEVEGIIREW